MFLPPLILKIKLASKLCITMRQVDNVCGGTWRAAKNQPTRKSSKIDETGLEIASCRHDVALKALNMHRGEIFPYPLYLQVK